MRRLQFVIKPVQNQIRPRQVGGARGGSGPPRVGLNALNALHGKAFSERSEDFSAAQRWESIGIFSGCRKSPWTFLTAWARKRQLPCLFCKRFPWVVTISDAWSYTKQKSGNPPAPDLNRPFLFPPQGGVTYEENRTCPLCQRRFKYSSDFWPSRHCSGRVWTMSLNSVNLNLTGFAGSCQTTEELHISIEGIQFGL